MRPIRAWAAFLVVLLLVSPVRAAAGSPPQVLLDGLSVGFDVPPVIVDGRTLVPFRAVAEALGVQVSWDPEARAVSARGHGATLVLYIDRTDALLDGRPISLQVPPQIMAGRTLVPLRFFSEAFGAAVGWDGTTRTISITSPPRPLHLEAFYAIQAYGQRSLIPLLDQVDFGWTRLQADGSLSFTGRDFYWPEPAGSDTPESIMAGAAKAGASRYLMVFAADAAGDLTRLLASDAAVSKAAAAIAGAVKDRGFDGALLDLEGLALTGDGSDPAAVQARFNTLVDQVAVQLHLQGKGLSLAVHPLNSVYHGYDYAHIASRADALVVMAYGYRQDRGPEPLQQVAEAVRLALAEGVDPAKLVLGINAYNEDGVSLPQKVGVAKRFGISGVALWRLGLLSDDELASLRASTSALKGTH